MSVRKMYLGVCFVFVFFFVLFGYEQRASLESKDYIMTLRFDYQDGKRTVSYEAPKLKKDAADSVLSNEQEFKSVEVDRYQEFSRAYMQVSDKEADFHHLKAVIISQELIRNKEEYKLFLEFLNEQNVIAENVLIFVDGSEKGLFDEERKGSIGAYLENLTDYEMKKQKNQIISAAKLLASFYNQNQTIYMPVVDDTLSVTGYEILCSGIWETNVDEKEGHILFLGNGWNTKDEFYLKDILEDGESVTEQEQSSIEIEHVRREIVFEERQGTVYVNCRLMIEGIGKDSNGKEILDYEEQKTYGAVFQELLQLSLEQQMEELQKIDVLNTFYELSNKDRELWKRFRHKYEAYKNVMHVSIDVEVELKE